MGKLADIIRYIVERGGHQCTFRGGSSFGDNGDLSFETTGRLVRAERDYSGNVVIWFVRDADRDPCRITISPEAETSGTAFESIISHGKWSLSINVVARSEKGRFVNDLGDATEVSRQENALVCRKCGKTMRSTSGKTLHERTCAGSSRQK